MAYPVTIDYRAVKSEVFPIILKFITSHFYIKITFSKKMTFFSHFLKHDLIVFTEMCIEVAIVSPLYIFSNNKDPDSLPQTLVAAVVLNRTFLLIWNNLNL